MAQFVISGRRRDVFQILGVTDFSQAGNYYYVQRIISRCSVKTFPQVFTFKYTTRTSELRGDRNAATPRSQLTTPQLDATRHGAALSILLWLDTFEKLKMD